MDSFSYRIKKSVYSMLPVLGSYLGSFWIIQGWPKGFLADRTWDWFLSWKLRIRLAFRMGFENPQSLSDDMTACLGIAAAIHTLYPDMYTLDCSPTQENSHHQDDDWHFWGLVAKIASGDWQLPFPMYTTTTSPTSLEIYRKLLLKLAKFRFHHEIHTDMLGTCHSPLIHSA